MTFWKVSPERKAWTMAEHLSWNSHSVFFELVSCNKRRLYFSSKGLTLRGRNNMLYFTKNDDHYNNTMFLYPHRLLFTNNSLDALVATIFNAPPVRLLKFANTLNHIYSCNLWLDLIRVLLCTKKGLPIACFVNLFLVWLRFPVLNLIVLLGPRLDENVILPRKFIVNDQNLVWFW